MRRRIRSAIAAGAVAIALVTAQAFPAQAFVLIKAGYGSPCTNRFKPASVSIGNGVKVVWKAVCDEHTVTSYGGNWSKDVTLFPGQTTSRIFKVKGVFRFRCKFHSALSNGVCSGMCGKVTVGA